MCWPSECKNRVNVSQHAVHLSEVEKKGRDAKVKVVEAIRESLDEYENLFLVEYEVNTTPSSA